MGKVNPNDAVEIIEGRVGGSDLRALPGAAGSSFDTGQSATLPSLAIRPCLALESGPCGQTGPRPLVLP